MTIKVWDYLTEYEQDREEILGVVDNVFKSGSLILGPNVNKFEEEFSKYCQTSYAVTVDNATNGIFLALKALNIGVGDEVITVANTAVPTVSAICQSGATPVFIDVNIHTGLMDISKLREVISSKTKCVIPVHLYGQCVDMENLVKMCGERNIFIIEDCSQSHGAKNGGVRCGSIGDMGVFSFYPTKPLGGYGDGGCVTTKEKKYYDKLKRLRFYGMKELYYAEELGYNSRMDEVQAAILRLKLKKLDSYIERRRFLANRYKTILEKNSLILPCEEKNNFHVYYVYVVRHKKRDYILAELKKMNIQLNISYPWPIHTMRGFDFLGYKGGALPNTEALAEEIFSLPMYPSLTEKIQDEFCSVLIDILEKI